MKGKYSFIFLLIPSIIFGQKTPSQAELQKMQQDMMQKVNAAMTDPKVKQYTDKSGTNAAGQQTDLSKFNIPSNPYSLQKPDTAFLSKIKNPSRNEKALASIPPKPMSKAELKTYLGDIKKKLAPVVQSSYGTSPLQTSGKSATAISGEAVLAFYAGKPEYSLLLGMESVAMDPENENALNNYAGILNLCGFPYKAVPILDYLKQQEPGNSTVNNNLGQAYAAMGDVQKAMAYLQQTVAQAPYHPNANMTLAYLAYASGDKSSAINYCENCLRGGFIAHAWNMLVALKPKAQLMDYVRHHYKQPETFNEHKYELPSLCTNTQDVDMLKAEYVAYHQMINNMKNKYSKMIKQENDYSKQNMANDMMNKIHSGQDPMRPFGWFATTVLGDIGRAHAEKLMDLDKYDKEYQQKHDALKQEFNDQLKAIDQRFAIDEKTDGEGGNNPDYTGEKCSAINELGNAYLPQFADLAKQRRNKWLYEERDYFNDFSFWCYIASTDDHNYHLSYYKLVDEYLALLDRLATTSFIKCGKKGDTTHKKHDSLSFEQMKCPFSAKIAPKNAKASVSIDCEKIGLDAEIGEGVSLKATHSATGATTLALEAGGSLIPKLLGGSTQFYITFGGGAPMDVGLKWEAEMTLPEALGGKNSAGWGFGLNSGVYFNGEGRLQTAASNWAQQNVFGLDPPAPQINPNVKMYNSNGGNKE